MNRLQRIIRLVRHHRPDLQLIDKHGVPWMQVAGIAMRPFMPSFMDGTTVVFGDAVYLPAPPDQLPQELLAQILAHELVHQLDQARLGAWFYVSYALLLPTGRTWRAYWERRAYAVDLMLAYEEAGEMGLDRARHQIEELFAGRAYGWMWAGRTAAHQYLEPVVAAVRDGTLQRQAPYAEILAAWTDPREVERSGEDAWQM